MREGPVIIGYDGSEVADQAIKDAAALLGPRPALVVTVWEAGVAYHTFPSVDIQAAPMDMRDAVLTDEAMYEGARIMAARGADLAAQQGFTAESLTIADQGNVATTLVQIAQERDAAALVVGARGHGRLERFFLGSTSRQILEHSPCPVIVVGPGER
jgi:nucleotide-binding universal stress UspA family protein